MSWSPGSNLFHDVFPIVTRYFKNKDEQLIYLSNFLDTLYENDMDCEDLYRFDSEVNSLLQKIEKRKEIEQKYLSAAETDLESKYDTGIVFVFLRKVRRDIQASELGKSKKDTPGKAEAFLEILALAGDYISDEEALTYFTGNLLENFHISKNVISEMAQDNPVIETAFSQMQSEDTEHDIYLAKLLKKEKNLPDLERDIKKLQSKLKRALRAHARRSEAETSQPEKTTTASPDIPQDTPTPTTTPTGKNKSATAKLDSAMLKRLSDTTNLPSKELERILRALQDLAVKELRDHGKFKLLSLLQIRARIAPATTASKGPNPFTGEEMLYPAKPERMRIKASPTQYLEEMLKPGSD